MTGFNVTMSWMIKCCLLVVLIDKCMNQEITYPVPFVIKAKERSARIKCMVDQSTLKSTALHLYRAQSGGALQRILHFEAGTTTAKTEEAFPRRFTGAIKQNEVTLTVSNLVLEDAGMYYCVRWSSDNRDRKVFGSGTRLYVTVSGKDKVKEPTLKAYKQSKIQGDKRTLVCQASDMVPDLVKFSWQTKSSSGDWTNVPDQQVIEQRDEVGKENPPNVVVTSMVIVDENTVKNNNYRCSVKHEGTTAPKTADITKDEGKSSAGNKDVVKATCPPIEENTEQKQKSETMDETPSLYLFIYAYGIMLMKNGVYFVAVSLYLFKRRFGKKNEST